MRITPGHGALRIVKSHDKYSVQYYDKSLNWMGRPVDEWCFLSTNGSATNLYGALTIIENNAQIATFNSYTEARLWIASLGEDKRDLVTQWSPV